MGRFRGRLAESASILADALDEMFRVDKEISRLAAYAGMLSDEDTRRSGPQGMQQEMQQLHADFRGTVAFVEPELLRAGAVVLERYLAGEPRLVPYRFFVGDLLRREAHTLSDAEEKLLADALPVAGSGQNIYNILANADFPYPTITLSDGRTVRLDPAGYADVRTSVVRDDRSLAMSTFFTALSGFGRTYGALMNAQIQRADLQARARRYPSHLASALDAPNIPVTVYARLVDGINAALPTFHRYLRLRKRMLAVPDDLHYFDLYAPLVASAQVRYTPEEAERVVVESLAPLGDDYTGVVRRAFRERWIDFLPTTGKRSGAYSEGAAYDVHPYILMNFLGLYNDVSTLTHELGHTMHSFYSNTRQPYALANYHTFVAEVASTFNEALLIEHVLARTTDRALRLSLLGSYLENIKSTVFRQTQFAEFELRMHEAFERGEPVTGDRLNALFLAITRRYYGHADGVCVVDDYVAHEWSYIPHFYLNFYVFQYATSFTAAEALSARVLAGDRAARDRYLTFLGSGTSKYPIDLLRDAGVDMTTDEPLAFTMRRMNAVMDEIDGLLGQA
jgi:oligoendopeptidase F